MYIIKKENNLVFNNAYCKPTLINDTNRGSYSMSVHFWVNNIPYYGQFNYETGKWFTLPSGEKESIFHDIEVEKWSYPSDSLNLLRSYAKQISNQSRIKMFNVR